MSRTWPRTCSIHGRCRAAVDGLRNSRRLVVSSNAGEIAKRVRARSSSVKWNLEIQQRLNPSTHGAIAGTLHPMQPNQLTYLAAQRQQTAVDDQLDRQGLV